jgi:sec-independent protein translocase protein TatA
MTPMLASILNLAGPDMIVILLIVLLMFGAKRLPELARGMGKAVREFGAARDEVERNFAQAGRSTVPAELVGTTSDRMPPE